MTEGEIKHEIAHGMGYAGLLLGVGAFKIATRLGVQHETMLQVIRELVELVNGDEARGQISSVAARTARHHLEIVLAGSATGGQSQSLPRQ